MVDVGAKAVTAREAIARGRIWMSSAAFEAIETSSVSKGDVLGIARIAGIQAAKRTSDWIPLAHPLPLESVELDFTPSTQLPGKDGRRSIEIRATARITAKTGVEMEALVAVSAAALCIYDMCKSIDREMSIDAIELVRKSGGKSGTYERAERS